MTESNPVSRAPQALRKTVATTITLGTVVGGFLQLFFPELNPMTAVFLSQTLCGALVAAVGSVSRDWIHELSEREPSERPSFWITQLSKLG